MKFGFIIDNRKCIGCHACTVACKSEHDVPVGVNRTWVKQTEKGQFPNTRRVFSVSRCNHCSDAPCVSICPTQALFTRKDGIVDFNNDRCIGCKSCMQACPYDALYIDPETNTAAKCNYCAHRVEIGLEPACVNVCPEHAIISGDMENPETEISQLLAREQVTVRKPEKGTAPNVFYINGDEASLNPSATEKSNEYIWSSQSSGVGHFAKYADQLPKEKSLADMLADLNGSDKRPDRPESQVQALMNEGGAKRVYDTPDKGLLWGWEVSSYLLTKAISAGIFLLLAVLSMLGVEISEQQALISGSVSLFFLLATGILLIKDLDRPDRFLYVLLRPQWESWLVRGGYSITVFGGGVAAWMSGIYFSIEVLEFVGFWMASVTSILVAIYTAFLFAQAKGRDFWQSPSLVLHMFIHSIMSGSSVLLLLDILVLNFTVDASQILVQVLLGGIISNLLIMFIEVSISHSTEDAKQTVTMIVKGRYANLFWVGVILVTNVIPFALLLALPDVGLIVSSMLILIGIYLTEKIWVEAPQRISLT